MVRTEFAARATRTAVLIAWFGVVSGCDGGSPDLSPCDIRTETCRQDVFLAVADVRNTGWDPWQPLPPARVITLAQYEKELAAEADAVQTTSRLVAWERSLQLLRLIPAGTSLADANAEGSAASVAAYYSNRHKNITVIDRGDPVDRRHDVYVLAHELVHAAQDRDVDLRAYFNHSTSFDDSMARSAQVEGEAVLYSNLVIDTMDGRSADNVDWTGYYGDWSSKQRADMASSQWPYFDVNGLVYPLGGQRVTGVWLGGGSAATRALWSGSPGTSADLMRGLRGSPVPPTCGLPAPPAGWTVSEQPFEFGALMLYAFAVRWTNESFAWQLGTEWQGDRITVFASSSSSSAAVAWVVRVSTNAFAAGLVRDIAAARDPSVVAQAFGSEVVLRASDDGVVLQALSPSCP